MLSKVELIEKTQAIIDQMPTRNTTYVILTIILLITVIVTLGFTIKIYRYC